MGRWENVRLWRRTTGLLRFKNSVVWLAVSLVRDADLRLARGVHM